MGADSLLGIASDDLGATGGGAAGALDSDGLEEGEEEEDDDEEEEEGWMAGELRAEDIGCDSLDVERSLCVLPLPLPFPLRDWCSFEASAKGSASKGTRGEEGSMTGKIIGCVRERILVGGFFSSIESVVELAVVTSVVRGGG